MFPTSKPRKPDRLDELAKDLPLGKDEYEEAKAEFTRIRCEVRLITDQGGAIVLGVDHPRGEEYRFEFRLPLEANWMKCDVKDLQGVLRRMAKSRELRYETYEWNWELLQGQVWKWYVKREDRDEKKRTSRSGAVGRGEGVGGHIRPEWDADVGEGNDDYPDELD